MLRRGLRIPDYSTIYYEEVNAPRESSGHISLFRSASQEKDLHQRLNPSPRPEEIGMSEQVKTSTDAHWCRDENAVMQSNGESMQLFSRGCKPCRDLLDQTRAAENTERCLENHVLMACKCG